MKRRKTRIQQLNKVKVRNIDGEIFLIDDVAGNIHHINLLGFAIWRLARKPALATEIVALLHGAFPDRPKRELRSDFLKVQKQMLDASLIHKVK